MDELYLVMNMGLASVYGAGNAVNTLWSGKRAPRAGLHERHDHPPMGPLHGIKVIDMTSVLMGPFASQSLGDMGADVVKVEAPQGDLVRQIGPAPPSRDGPDLPQHEPQQAQHRDRPQEAGRAARSLHRLLADADVLVYNVRPNAMARLGLGYETRRRAQPAPRLRRPVRLRPGRARTRRAPRTTT